MGLQGHSKTCINVRLHSNSNTTLNTNTNSIPTYIQSKDMDRTNYFNKNRIVYIGAYTHQMCIQYLISCISLYNCERKLYPPPPSPPPPPPRELCFDVQWSLVITMSDILKCCLL